MTTHPDIRHASGVGLGFRRELLADMQHSAPNPLHFFELAPENWAGMGGSSAKKLDAFAECYPLVCHGLSLDLGGQRPLDVELLERTKAKRKE